MVVRVKIGDRVGMDLLTIGQTFTDIQDGGCPLSFSGFHHEGFVRLRVIA